MKEKLIKFLKFNKGYLLSSISVIGIYSFFYLLKNKHVIPFRELSYVVPGSFIMIFLFTVPIRFMLRNSKE